jgi:hypothetical protein
MNFLLLGLEAKACVSPLAFLEKARVMVFNCIGNKGKQKGTFDLINDI